MEIECKFKVISIQRDGSPFKKSYSCVIWGDKQVSVKNRFTRISSFKGKHRDGKSNDDVKMVIFKDVKLHYIPLDMNKHFPKMDIFASIDCGLKDISKQDLVGLSNLEVLVVYGSLIETIPSDLFEKLPKLSGFYLRDSKLKFVSPKLLTPIVNNNKLTVIDLGNFSFSNIGFKIIQYPTLSDLYTYIVGGKKKHTGTESLNIFSTMIDENFTPPPKDDLPIIHDESILKGFAELWMDKAWADFTIVVGASEYKVHKVVLASQSSAFKTMFLIDMKESQCNKLEIADCEAEDFEEFLESLYTGKKPKAEHVAQVLRIASKYCVESLKTLCEDVIVENLNKTNADEVFKLGNQLMNEYLKHQALGYI